MAYTTYGFYTNTYYGDAVTESSFPKWNDRASDELDHLCGGSITDEVLAEYSTQIQKATCTLIDLISLMDLSSKNATDKANVGIKSMSSGGQSVTFGENVITKALADVKAQKSLYRDAIVKYLGDTDLLYEGVD